MRAITDDSPPVANRADADRILSTAGFITSPEGGVEVVQGIFVDTVVSRVI